MSKEINWYAKANSSGQGLVIEEGTGRTVAVAYDQKDTALLAAAPDMKEAMKKAMQHLDDGEGGAAWEVLEAALALAEN